MITRTTFLSCALLFTIGVLPPDVQSADEPSTQDSSTKAVTDASTVGLDHLRAAIKDAYNHGDIELMARYLHPDVVIIFPDGRILKGRDAFRDYYKEMMTGPNHRVASYSADPQVESRTVHNDVGLSYGNMNDSYVLNDGTSFNLNSRFTVTVFRSPDGPVDTDGWMIRSFHSSPDTFDNPILKMLAHRLFMSVGASGLAIGVVFGVIIGFFVGRRRKNPPPRAN